MTKKTIEKQYTKLSEIDHCLLRPGRYLGAITPHKDTIWIPNETFKMELQDITYNPAFLKIFDEIITNSVDHSKRPEGAHLDTIKVTVTDTTISIFDNGGIPVIIHPQYNQWIPEMIFELRSGSNIDDSEESTRAGQNGEGLGICCIFTTKFLAETCDGQNSFQMVFSENSKVKSTPKVVKSKSAGFTKFTYTPDLPRFGMKDVIDEDNIKMLFSRTVEIAATNPNLKVYWNGKKIDIKSFKDYINLFQDEYVYDENQYFKIGITKSNEGFQHTSFVNTTRTKIGGNHINYVANQIIDGVRTYIKKKTKVDVKPADIKNHFHLFIDAKIVNPRYSSQTKDELITEVSNFGASWSMPDKFLSKVLKSEIIKSILDWVQVKEQALENEATRKKAKDLNKIDPKDIENFTDAVSKKDRHLCSIFLTEGLSALNSIQSARGDNINIGSFALKGKPLNVYDVPNSKVIENVEFFRIMAATGLQIGQKVNSVSDLRFGRIAILTDTDRDGFHAGSLLLNFFNKFWPELFELGVIYIMLTPLYIANMGKKEYEFFSIPEYKEWADKNPKHTSDYFKGLGGFNTKQFAKFLSNVDNYLIKIDSIEQVDSEKLKLVFSDSTQNERKEWLSSAIYFEDGEEV